MSPDEYAATGGRVCPTGCEGTDLARRDYDQADANTVTRNWCCSTCGATWTAVYALTGYEGLCVPREETQP